MAPKGSKLKEYSDHLVNFIMQRAGCEVRGSLRVSFIWSFLFVVKWLCHYRSRRQTAWRCSESRRSAGGCTDRRRLKFGLQDHLAGSNFSKMLGLLKVWCHRSILPCVCGWYGASRECFMPFPSQPLSEVTAYVTGSVVLQQPWFVNDVNLIIPGRLKG